MKKVFYIIITIVSFLFLSSCNIFCKHNFIVSYQTSTCEDHGHYLKECTNCHHQISYKLPLAEHDYEEIERVSSTCSTLGYIIYECKACHKQDKVSIPLLEHSFDSTIVAPSCLEEGFTKKTCINCGHIEKSNFVPCLGHHYTDYIFTIYPTDTKEGLMERTCIGCEQKDTKVVAPTLSVDTSVLDYDYDNAISNGIASKEDFYLFYAACQLRNIEEVSVNLNFTLDNLDNLFKGIDEFVHTTLSSSCSGSLRGKTLTLKFKHFNKPTSSVTYDLTVSEVTSLNYEVNDFSTTNLSSVIKTYDKSYPVYTSDGLWYVLEHRFNPDIKDDKVKEIYEALVSVLNKIINENDSDVLKVKALHDYIISNVTYDNALLKMASSNMQELSKYYGFYLEGAVLEKYAVCEGIAKMFSSMCNLIGIPCFVVTGKSVDENVTLGHAWNKVYVDHNWYIVDCTSDNLILNNKYEVLTYNYFLISDKNMNNTYLQTSKEIIPCKNDYDIFKEVYLNNDSLQSLYADNILELNKIIESYFTKTSKNVTLCLEVNQSLVSTINYLIKTKLSYIGNNNPLYIIEEGNKITIFIS